MNKKIFLFLCIAGLHINAEPIKTPDPLVVTAIGCNAAITAFTGYHFHTFAFSKNTSIFNPRVAIIAGLAGIGLESMNAYMMHVKHRSYSPNFNKLYIKKTCNNAEFSTMLGIIGGSTSVALQRILFAIPITPFHLARTALITAAYAHTIL